MGSIALDTPEVLQKLDTRLFINGKFQSSKDGKQFEVINPYTQKLAALVHEASEDDANDAVSAARDAFPAWRDLSPTERGVYLRRLSELIRPCHKELAYLDTANTGRPVSQFFLSELAANFLRYFAERGWSAQGTSSFNTPNHLNISVKQPYGVTVCVAHSNLPLLTLAYDVGPALIAGNTVVLKSSERAPLSLAYISALVEKANFPPGVLNIISGAPSGPCLASHMDVRCLSHVSAVPVAQKVLTAAITSNMKHVRTHLSAKSPALVFADADLDSAAKQAAVSIGILNGMSCYSNSRIYVEESVAEEFEALFREKYSNATLGDPLDPDTFIGPQRDEQHYERVKSFIELGQKHGTLTAGGDDGNGLFIKPTIIENIPEDSPVVQEEIFGPVVIINTFKNESDAVEKANNTRFGLYASAFTKNFDRILRLSKILDAGTVCINCTSPTMADDMPFGGHKMSGRGSGGLLDSMEDFLETKTILMKGNPLSLAG